MIASCKLIQTNEIIGHYGPRKYIIFFESKQLESHCRTEKRVQQSQKEKLNTMVHVNIHTIQEVTVKS